MLGPRSTVTALGAFPALAASALLLVACTGKTLSLGNGTGSQQSQEVAPSAVSGSVSACSSGSAHPNACCSAGPNQASSCVTYPQAPFTQCESGTTTYPDPRTCCPLDGSGSCEATPPTALDAGSSSSGSGGSGASGGGCSYACPPGWYAPDGNTDDGCCTTDSNGGSECMGSGGSSGSSCVCACDDSGVCPPCNCPEEPATTCAACPPGWQTPQGGDPTLCCTTDGSGVIECFSQAGSSTGVNEALDAGGGFTSGACSGTGSADGALGPCGCQESGNGHTYNVNCDPGTNTCTCTIDNGAPVATFSSNGNACTDSNMLFSSCGFPAQ